MRKAWVLAATAVSGTATIASLTIAAAAGVASADESAIVTIGNLEAQGFTVNVDRVGSAPLDQCIVTDIRNPQEVTQRVRVGGDDGGWHGDDDDDDGHWGFSGDSGHYVEVVVSRSITVSLDCTG